MLHLNFVTLLMELTELRFLVSAADIKEAENITEL
jgi:hypothetical protein